jgi:hypothetical protein
MQKYVKIIFLGMVKPGDNIPITERERMIEEVVKPNRKTLRVKQRFDLNSKLKLKVQLRLIFIEDLEYFKKM